MYMYAYLYICMYRDGVIEAYIDHEKGWLINNELSDIYITEDPQKAFHK